jgi:hypothetical protein
MNGPFIPIVVAILVMGFLTVIPIWWEHRKKDKQEKKDTKAK